MASCFESIALGLVSFTPMERSLDLHFAARALLDADAIVRVAEAVGGLPTGSKPLQRYLMCMRSQPMTFSQRLRLLRLDQTASV